MTGQWKNPRFYVMLFCDSAVFAAAFAGAYALRFEFSIDHEHMHQIVALAPVIVAIQLSVFFIFGLYRGMWRFTSVVDFWRLGQACLISTLLAFAYVFLCRVEHFPRTILILSAALTLLMAGGIRVCIRCFYLAGPNFNKLNLAGLAILKPRLKGARRVMLIGAGSSGEKILREINENPNLSFYVVGFLDDDRSKWGRTVHGVPVYGSTSVLPRLVQKLSISQVFISIPSATGTDLRRIIDTCKACGVPYKTLPGIGEIMDGKVSVKTLRDVDYTDLLRRKPIRLDMDGIRNYLTGQTVLVTGCGGSIGAELCRQLVRFSPAKLILFDLNEENLFNIETELRNLNFLNCQCVLGPVQHRELSRQLFSRFRPQIVFHAAAYKHVPMLEQNCWVAVFNNVLGSKVIMELAVEFGVRQFVLVSTDKAVRPTSVMGVSKRLAELIMLSLRGNGTQFKAVRFGNVVGSSGSVIPVFRRQIELGGPVTVTHPDVTRYFMTIPEAAQLIIQAGALGEEGEIFILEMGTPVKIAEMALDLIRLSGKEPGKDVDIKFVGLRPGEKLNEELTAWGEDIVKTKHDKIMVVRSNGDVDKTENSHAYFNQQLWDLFRIACAQDSAAIKRKLREMIPEYNPEASGAGYTEWYSNEPPEQGESPRPDGFRSVAGARR
ncbi:MAG TPA: nucleoside-diphosphate sugar epimerase/dehydratase [Syntrophobacteraceae bacterium]|nr:nucleoside-diphosphate sugar epimerase/dehydratase [Syntrophobacteraceae bacterium]